MPVQIDMKMPESCEACPFPSYGSHGIFCAAMKRYADIPEDEIWERRADDCPLVETEDRNWHVMADGDLPQKEDQYLVTISANDFVEVLKGFWKHGRMDFINEDGCYFDDLNLVATAWMKWPEPWEGAVK